MINDTGHPVKFLRTSLLVPLVFTALLRAADAPSKIDLPGSRAFPESITSTSDGIIFVGNIAEGGILRVKNGNSGARFDEQKGDVERRQFCGNLESNY